MGRVFGTCLGVREASLHPSTEALDLKGNANEA